MSDQNKTKKELLEEIQSLRATLQLQEDQAANQALETNMIASAMDAILAIDEDQNIVQFNAAAEHIFGYKAETVLGKSVHLLLPGHFRESHQRHVQSYITTGDSLRATYSLGTLTGLRANGEVFPIEISISVAIVESKKLYFAILRDVSERLKLEQLMVNQYDALNSLHQITLHMLNQRDIDELLQFIVNEAAKLLNAPYCEIMLPEGDELVARAFTQNHPFPTGNRFTRTDAPLSWKVFETGMPATVGNYSNWEPRNPIYEEHNFHATAGIPILVGKKCIGVLGLARNKAGDLFKEEDILSATRFADIAALAMENSRMYREIKALATTDELTGVNNRRNLMDLGELEVQRSIRYKRPLSALMLDVDHFKHINDTWGHPVGDLVLRGIAQQCANLIRKTDMLGRYGKESGNNGYVIGRFGGEEFAILLPETPLEQAVIVAERIRNSIDQMVFKALTESTHTLIHATASLGVSSLDTETDTFLDLLTRADQALYTAKQSGRNRVCVFDKHILDTLT